MAILVFVSAAARRRGGVRKKRVWSLDLIKKADNRMMAMRDEKAA